MTGNDKPIVDNEWDEVESDYDPREDLHSEATIRTMLAFDIAPDALLVDKPEALGLERSSQDVFEAEMQGSQQRRNNIRPLIPLVVILSRLTAEVQNATIVEMADEGDEVVETTPQKVLSASIGILATLVDMGALVISDPTMGGIE